jgi:vacuolar-type H+-ATPase subunit E/Vma4
MDGDSWPVVWNGPDLITFQNNFTETTEASPLNIEIYPKTYKISAETVTEMKGGKIDAENTVEGLCNIDYI